MSALHIPEYVKQQLKTFTTEFIDGSLQFQRDLAKAESDEEFTEICLDFEGVYKSIIEREKRYVELLNEPRRVRRYLSKRTDETSVRWRRLFLSLKKSEAKIRKIERAVDENTDYDDLFSDLGLNDL